MLSGRVAAYHGISKNGEDHMWHVAGMRRHENGRGARLMAGNGQRQPSDMAKPAAWQRQPKKQQSGIAWWAWRRRKRDKSAHREKAPGAALCRLETAWAGGCGARSQTAAANLAYEDIFHI